MARMRPASPDRPPEGTLTPSGGEAVQRRPLEEALALVHHERHGEYGHPADDFARTAGMLRALFGWDVQTRDVPLVMACVKLSRLRQSPEHRDSIVDLAGYGEAYWMVVEREREQRAGEG